MRPDRQISVSLGDFSQLKPVGGQSLAHHRFSMAGHRSLCDTRSVGGQSLFMGMADWVVLNGQNNRFEGVYRDIMERVRLGQETDEAVRLLNTRVVGSGDATGQDCHESTFVVFRNKIRSKLSLPFVRASCLRRQR